MGSLYAFGGPKIPCPNLWQLSQLHRCYVIWRGQKCVLLASTIVLVADTVWGYIGTRNTVFSLQKIFIPVYLWIVFSMNILMTIVTVGRIWWLAQSAKVILGRQDVKRYHTAVAVLAGSGAIYSIAVMLLVVVPPRPYLDLCRGCHAGRGHHADADDSSGRTWQTSHHGRLDGSKCDISKAFIA